MSLFDVPEGVLDARPEGARDFDFLQGCWIIRHRKLAERLVGCQTWGEIETGKVNWYRYFTRAAVNTRIALRHNSLPLVLVSHHHCKRPTHSDGTVNRVEAQDDAVLIVARDVWPGELEVAVEIAGKDLAPALGAVA